MIGRQINPWFVVDFGELRIKPTHYTLKNSNPRGRSNYGRRSGVNLFDPDHEYVTKLMRGWNFEGSNDQKQWTMLKQHSGDLSLQDNQLATFPIDDCEEYYRSFRIYATEQQQITSSLFEIYGHVL